MDKLSPSDEAKMRKRAEEQAAQSARKPSKGGSFKRAASAASAAGAPTVRQAKLTLVDLAGSERVERAGTKGVGLSEGIQINKSLL